MARKPRVPETQAEVRPNREQRRHPERQPRTGGDQPGDQDPKQSPAEEMLGPERTQDDFSVRAKNSGHGKKTADKWNQ